jgi:hypothetical protein
VILSPAPLLDRGSDVYVTVRLRHARESGNDNNTRTRIQIIPNYNFAVLSDISGLWREKSKIVFRARISSKHCRQSLAFRQSFMPAVVLKMPISSLFS